MAFGNRLDEVFIGKALARQEIEECAFRGFRWGFVGGHFRFGGLGMPYAIDWLVPSYFLLKKQPLVGKGDFAGD